MKSGNERKIDNEITIIWDMISGANYSATLSELRVALRMYFGGDSVPLRNNLAPGLEADRMATWLRALAYAMEDCAKHERGEQ